MTLSHVPAEVSFLAADGERISARQNQLVSRRLTQAADEQRQGNLADCVETLERQVDR